MELAHRAVMADVARHAGVSVMTVSRVLNDFPGVTDKTRRRVERSVTALGYRANSAARILAGGRSHTLGVVVVETQQYGPSHLLFGIETAARAANHTLTFATMQHTDVDGLRDVVQHLWDLKVEGVIVVAPLRRVVDAVVELKSRLPLVLTCGDPSVVASTVTIDQYWGARSATEHLLDLGHETVHHISGPRSWIDASERIRGWADALRDRGAERGSVRAGDWTARSGYTLGKRLARDPSVTAVFAANDQTAQGLLRALHEQGRSVPDEVSVVGFDDTPESGYFLPPLTTVRQNFSEVGRNCVELLLARLEAAAPGDECHMSIRPKLIVRDSSAPPPSS